jgi:hypothetical protein
MDEVEFVEQLIKQFVLLIVKDDENTKYKYNFTTAFNKAKPVLSESDLKNYR